MIRLLMADDHELVRHAIGMYLSMHPEITVQAEASSGAELLEKLKLGEFDLVMMDLQMPGISGAELVSCVRKQYPKLRILVLSAYGDVQTVSKVLKAGASGYVHKGCRPAVLLDAIIKTVTTGKFLEPEFAEKLAFTSITPDEIGIELILTERELQIFEKIIKGKCIKTIGNELFISDKTVSTHKAHLLAKLNLESVPDLVRYAIENNLFKE